MCWRYLNYVLRNVLKSFLLLKTEHELRNYRIVRSEVNIWYSLNFLAFEICFIVYNGLVTLYCIDTVRLNFFRNVATLFRQYLYDSDFHCCTEKEVTTCILNLSWLLFTVIVDVYSMKPTAIRKVSKIVALEHNVL